MHNIVTQVVWLLLGGRAANGRAPHTLVFNSRSTSNSPPRSFHFLLRSDEEASCLLLLVLWRTIIRVVSLRTTVLTPPPPHPFFPLGVKNNLECFYYLWGAMSTTSSSCIFRRRPREKAVQMQATGFGFDTDVAKHGSTAIIFILLEA